MIVHLAVFDQKFIEPYIEFIDNNFNSNDHVYFIHSRTTVVNNVPQRLNVIDASGGRLALLTNLPRLIKMLQKAEKIILHGLFDHRIVLLLTIQPWLLRKCYWVIWGGDLYLYRNPDLSLLSAGYEWIRQFVIKRFGNLVTYIVGDYELAKQVYNASGRLHRCLAYQSNVMSIPILKDFSSDSRATVFIGNSADPENMHLDIFELLKGHDERIAKYIVPLSYSGNTDYVNKVCERGRILFGAKFMPLLQFMPAAEYRDLLLSASIGVFGHRRQQAMGNIICLLGGGKQVFLRDDVTHWSFFKDLNINIYKLQDFSVEEVGLDYHNMNVVRDYFSTDNLRRQWQDIFSD